MLHKTENMVPNANHYFTLGIHIVDFFHNVTAVHSKTSHMVSLF